MIISNNSKASFACSASEKTATLQGFPVPAGKEIALITVCYMRGLIENYCFGVNANIGKVMLLII